jgi:hypothetical protein
MGDVLGLVLGLRGGFIIGHGELGRGCALG